MPAPPEGSLPAMVSAMGGIRSQDSKGGYLSQTAIPGAIAPPTVSARSAFPGCRKPAGTRTLSCITPIIPGALLANSTSARTPAMVTVTGSRGLGGGSAAGLPATLAPSVRPSPVAKSVSTVAGGAGEPSPFGVPSLLVICGRGGRGGGGGGRADGAHH